MISTSFGEPPGVLIRDLSDEPDGCPETSTVPETTTVVPLVLNSVKVIVLHVVPSSREISTVRSVLSVTSESGSLNRIVNATVVGALAAVYAVEINVMFKVGPITSIAFTWCRYSPLLVYPALLF